MAEERPTIHCNFSSEASLYLAYMPFVKGGGLFVRTVQNHSLSEEVDLSLTLLNEPEPYTIEAKVVWITPKGAQGNKPAGIGLQFMGDNSRNITNKIETCLAGMLKSTQPTDTL